MRMPPLTTARLLIRPFVPDDLDAIHRILDSELADADMGTEGRTTLDARRSWLQWAALNHEELARLYQPPYGDRAIVLRASGELIGACGYVPCLGPYGQLPNVPLPGAIAPEAAVPEVGLYYAISPRHQRRGYATEAARALIDYAFAELRLGRIIATTTDDNAASQGVMRALEMDLARNSRPTPPWLQVVGVLTNPNATSSHE